MKHKSGLIALLVVMSALMTSCVFDLMDTISGNGNVKVESRDISDFKSIDASGGLNVYVTFGKSLSLEVEADENLQEIIKTEVFSGTLKIYASKTIRHSNAKNIKITVPSLEEFEISSAADVRCENILNVEKLRISVSSAGNLRLEADAREINVDVSSSGDVELRGKTNDLKVQVSSAGSLNAEKLMAKFCEVSASSAGGAKIYASKGLNADASSAGNIEYQGEPENVRVNTSSAGSINKR